MNSKKDSAWSRLELRLLQRARVFDIYSQRMRSPDGRIEDDFFFLESADWVNIIPLTAKGEVILVEQYRHGINAPSLEIPGGIVGENESPLESGKRELIEETGYSSECIQEIGWTHPNPAIQVNRCHFFLATEVEKVSEQSLDETEDIKVLKVPLEKIPRLLANGQISHSLVIASFCHFILKKGAGFGFPGFEHWTV